MFFILPAFVQVLFQVPVKALALVLVLEFDMPQILIISVLLPNFLCMFFVVLAKGSQPTLLDTKQ